MDESIGIPSFQFDQPFMLAGEWWLPENKSYRVPGKLTYSAESGFAVELGRFLLPTGYAVSERQPIHGKLQFAGDVTLFDALPTEWLTYGQHVHPQKLVATALLTGGTVESLDSTVLGICLHLDALNDWVSHGPFRSLGSSAGHESGKLLRYSYDVDMSPLPNFDIATIDAKLTIRASCEEKSIGHSITLKHEHSLSLQYNKPVPLKNAIEHAHCLELLFTLLTGGPSKIETFKVSLPEPQEFGPIDSHLLYSRGKISKGRRLFPRDHMPAALEHVIEDFGQILSDWFIVCDKFASVTKLVAASLFQPELGFLEHRFLTLAQAIEGYCRIAHHEKYLRDDDFKPIRQSMIDCLPKDGSHFRSVAVSKLAFLNDFTLRDRLLSLFDRHKWLLLVLPDKDNPNPSSELGERFASKVRTVRNTLTHVESGKPQSAKADFPIVYRLKLILCMLLLYEVGIDIENRYRDVTNTYPSMWWMDWSSSP